MKPQLLHGTHVDYILQRHTFRQPAKRLEPPTPRTSLLGLDKLAKEKREAATDDKRASGEGSRKKPRLDDGDEPFFKGARLFVFKSSGLISFIVPSLPASRSANIRQRGEETPSHPGGLSDVGRQRLEEHRKNREKQRGEYSTHHEIVSTHGPAFCDRGLESRE